jgi:hypothetical protein
LELKRLADGRLDNLFYAAIGDQAIPRPEEEARFPAVMQVAMVGYPIGLWDEINNLPISRRGTTASHPAVNFNGLPQVVIDMACFPGSSGSPVLFFDRDYFAGAQRFLGVLYAGPVFSSEGAIKIRDVPTRIEAFPVVQSMVHLGYVIKAREVLTLVNSTRLS